MAHALSGQRSHAHIYSLSSAERVAVTDAIFGCYFLFSTFFAAGAAGVVINVGESFMYL